VIGVRASRSSKAVPAAYSDSERSGDRYVCQCMKAWPTASSQAPMSLGGEDKRLEDAAVVAAIRDGRQADCGRSPLLVLVVLSDPGRNPGDAFRSGANGDVPRIVVYENHRLNDGSG
jgi:hypothetical protein